MYLGGDIGNLTGKAHMRRIYEQDPEATKRILVGYHTWQARRALGGVITSDMSEFANDSAMIQGSVIRELENLNRDSALRALMPKESH